MKGQVAVILMLLFLIVGVLVFIVLSVVFIPILKAVVVTPVLEQPIVGIITAFLGFLPDQCSVFTSLECRFCIITQKIVPLVVNTVLGVILFSVLLSFMPIIGWSGKEEVEGGSAERESGLVRRYGPVILMSIAFSIFMLHQSDPLVFLNWMTMFMAIAVRILAFMVSEGGNLNKLRRFTDFFLGANILVAGWSNLWIVPIVLIVGLTFVTTIVRRPGGNEGPRMHFTQWNMMFLIVLLLVIGFYGYAVFEFKAPTPFGSLPTPIRYPGLAGWLSERFNLENIKCGPNSLGPDSSISF